MRAAPRRTIDRLEYKIRMRDEQSNPLTPENAMKPVSDMTKAEKLQLVRDYTTVMKYSHVRKAFDDLIEELDIRIQQQVIMAQALAAIREATDFDGAKTSADIALIAVESKTEKLPHL